MQNSEMYWWNEKQKLAVVEIPKNASTSFRHNFKSWPHLDTVELFKQNKAQEVIVVFRDPYERFLSAINRYMDISNWTGDSRSKYRPDITPEVMFPWYIPNHFNHNESIFKSDVDVHFLPQNIEVQRRFYVEYPERYTFFWMSKENDVVLDVQAYLWNKYKITPPRYGEIKENVGPINIIKEVDETIVKNTYRDDYEFFEYITKERGWENK